ncbi:MAG TPA: hypothetical protein VFE79_13675 [Paraburkholderia sp.]|nr:hypothetical protein [Paraburkholderia sp.]
MNETLGPLSWFLFNIVVPVFAPLALLPLLSLSHDDPRTSHRIAIQSIQDGQLL